MIYADSADLPLPGESSLDLRYGALQGDVDCKGFRICNRGMSFKSRWPFQVGTELSVEFEVLHGDAAPPGTCHPVTNCSDSCGANRPRRIQAQGFVADSALITETCGCYLITLVFVDLPDETRKRLAEFSSRLIARIG